MSGTAMADTVAATHAPAGAVQPVSVTLITGDTVTVSPHGTAVDRAPGRTGIRFVQQNTGSNQYVIPIDALPLLRAGRLDMRLFDVTALQRFGYTSGHDLPLLVQYPKTGASKARAAVTGKARVHRDLTRLGMLAIHKAPTARADLWTSLTGGTDAARTFQQGIERIYLDGRLQPSDDVSNAQIGAPAAWQQGLDGTGVTVGVLDTGIDTTHPDLSGKIAASANFTDAASIDDALGHGTHVASVIAGSGAKSGGKYKGVAPGSKLAVGKVCTLTCDESALLAGMQWAAPIAPVVNISLNGYPVESPDPISQAIEELSEVDGTLFVISAGNEGYKGPGSVQWPADAPSALTVGAVDANDQVAYFSARGPVGDDQAIKPDITAPGVGIVAARAANGTEGTPVTDGYVSMDGTSMATPHVAAAAAIVTEQHPGWSARQRKTLLMGAAQPTATAGAFDQGAGRLDVARAVSQAVSVDQGSVSFGQQRWPHTDDTPITKTITYRNGGTAPVTLALAVQGDTDTFTVGATSLTVPAGGTANTTVTADTSGAGADGLKSAWVVATAPGGLRVDTPLGIDRMIETHNVTLRHIGRDGQPNPNYFTALIGLDGTGSYQYYLGQEAETISVPRGTYGLVSTLFGPADTTMLVQTVVIVDAAKTITLDARQGKPVAITPPRGDAKRATAKVGANWSLGNTTAGWSTESPIPGDLYTAQIGPATARAGFVSSITSVFAKWKNDQEGFADSPWTYETNYVRNGTFYTGFAKRILPSELTTLKQHFAREADGVTGLAYNWATFGDNTGYSVRLPFSLPFERTVYIGGTPGVTDWTSEFSQQVVAGDDLPPTTISQSAVEGLRLQPGTVQQQEWNKAVFAPSAAGATPVAVRDGNQITASVPLFTDGTGKSVLPSDGSARTTLYANGTMIGDLGDAEGTFSVPAAGANYRLEMSANRPSPSRLSTSTGAAWTFVSKNGDTQLPISTVRFSPRLDTNNTAKKGSFTVPVTVERTAGSPAAPNRTLTAQFSTDDGTTWHPATVTGRGNQRILHVANPPSGYMSLRVTAVDTAGNTVTETVLRAYAID
ncbi:S8 family serine peptidase [Actinoplanes sp. NPDC049596]|uniref:S8 family serine peptidase n=1 Tax=unclassified Actinoplanes TaxID=2626549 RepID=UPI003422C54A